MKTTNDLMQASTAEQFSGDAYLSGASMLPADEQRLREALKRCSPATIEAARQLREHGNLEFLPVFVAGMIARYVEPDLRHKVDAAKPELLLIEDLGLDSLTLMEVVVLAEEVLPVTISNDELRHLRSLGDVQQFLAEKLRPSPALLEGEPPLARAG